MLIKNVRIISPDVDLPGASIEIEGRVIRNIHTGDRLPDAETVHDARGAMALPGFIDLHIHGALGHDVTDGTHEAVEKIAESKLKEGVTTFCPTTLTLPEADLARAMEAVASYRKCPTWAKVAGVHLEGPFLSREYMGAQNPAHVRAPDMDEILRLNAITKVAIVTFAIEAEGGLEMVESLRGAGIVPSCGHSGATYEQFRQAMDRGLKHLTHFCNQMSPLHHREIGLVGAGLLDDDILIEMICDRHHLCPEMIRLAFKLKAHEKIALVADAVCAAGLDDGTYTLGGLEVLLEGGVVRLKGSDNLAGSTLRLNKALKNVHEVTGLPLMKIVRTTSLNQAESLGLEKLGRIEAGYLADIVILDKDFNVRDVYVEGTKRI
jgi:N-acetylglucosamine-6-phosphate deacetylase